MLSRSVENMWDQKPTNDGLNDDNFSRLFDLDCPPDIPKTDVTAIVLCHNEATRLRHFLDYHKACGVGHFLVVDNASTDGSAVILDEDPDVTRFPSRRPYSECKSIWREVLADLYLVGRWAVFLDVDELLLHPTSPNEGLPDYAARLEAAGYECLLAVMVDMYPADADTAKSYEPGTPFLNYAPYFDTGNYRIESYTAKQLKRYPTPSVAIRGGARERLFHEHAIHHGICVQRILNRLLFSMSRSLQPGTFRRVVDTYVQPITSRINAGPGLPNMSKLSLLRWRAGCKFSGGPHRIDAAMKVAPDLAALLHFKHLGDFAERAAYNASRGQHVKGAAHYRHYLAVLEKESRLGFSFAGTRRFTGPESLRKARLLRRAL